LLEENVRLKAQLRYQQRTAREGFFGSSTPSAKVPVKPNAPPAAPARPCGGQPGHAGHGRPSVTPLTAQLRLRLTAPARCPDCGRRLQPKGTKRRTVIDCQPPRPQRVLYELESNYCPHCRHRITAQPPGVLPKNLLSNRLLTYVAVQHYLYGIPLGTVQRQLGLAYGSLCQAMRQLARRLEPIPIGLVREFRRAAVRHADETGWRTDGHNGYAWVFCTARLVLFRFRRSRAAAVAQEVFGRRRLGGTTVVDRYSAYNRLRTALQYCYAHLLREVRDLLKQFPEQAEVRRFVETFAPLLSAAMRLRAQPISDRVFYCRARALRREIIAAARQPAQHPAVQNIQNLFREKADRLYHWAEDRAVPADNNRAERELRPLVIARKVSFGSQSEAGAHTREVLMSVLHTLQKRTPDVQAALERLLDQMAEDSSKDPYKLLVALDSS
jgi:transposase